MTVHCLTPNPAVDVTYTVDEVRLHRTNRITAVSQRPGGKGVNVARVLASQGYSPAVYGPLGGTTGSLLRAMLSTTTAVTQRWTAVPAETRRTIAVVDLHDTTMFNEPGPVISSQTWADTMAELARCVSPGDVVTVSGSMPQGLAPEAIAAVVHAVRERGGTSVVDTSGPALVAAAQAQADVVKPNHHELTEATGEAEPQSGAEHLIRLGAGGVVASMGGEGLFLVSPDRVHAARLDKPLVGNPTGAGDALVAALAAQMSRRPDGQPLSDTLVAALPHAVAWSAAAVLAPVAGEIRTSDITTLIHHVLVEEQ